MSVRFDALLQGDSPLGRRDPRWKLACLLPAVACVALFRTPQAAGLALAGTLVLNLASRLPVRWLAVRLGAVTLMLLPFVLLLPLLAAGEGPAWSVGPVTVHGHGARAALLLALKAWTIVGLMLVLLAMSPLAATLQAAHALYLPSLVVQIALLAYRYVFLIAGELARLRVALRVRGFRTRLNRHSYRTAGHVAGVLLVRGYERAERVSQAMICRGFDGQFRSLAAFHTTWADRVLFFVVLCSALALLMLDVAWR